VGTIGRRRGPRSGWGRRLWRRSVVLPVLIGLLALSVAGCGGGGRTIRGWVNMSPVDNFERLDWLDALAGLSPGSDGALPLTPCVGPTRLKLKGLEGATVTIRDASDKIVATATLGPGALNFADDVRCEFEFSAERVAASDFYTFAIGSRNPVTVSADELEHAGWTVTLQVRGG
jgi:hypothetical protein